MSTIVSFVSQKGGVGKTTSAVNLATAFAIGGYRALLLDLDPQGSVRYSLGIESKSSFGTRELFLDSTKGIKHLIQQTSEHPNLHFIFSNIEKISDERKISNITENSNFLDEIFKSCAMNYDFIVIDAPASTNNLAINTIVASDLIVLPIQCESLAIKSLKRFLISFQELQDNIKDKELRLAGILLTMYDKTIPVHRKVTSQMYKALSNSVFETIIPKNNSLIEASALGKSIITHKFSSIGSTAYIRFMNEILDKFSLR